MVLSDWLSPVPACNTTHLLACWHCHAASDLVRECSLLGGWRQPHFRARRKQRHSAAIGCMNRAFGGWPQASAAGYDL
jgi:hypothetical protein